MIFKEITIREAKELIKEIKENKEYNSLVKELEYFISLKDNQISNEVLNELQELMGRIKKLIELDEKIKEKEDMIKLFEEISADFKEQNIRKEDLSKISNGELFKIVEEIDSINGKEEKNLDLIFITS